MNFGQNLYQWFLSNAQSLVLMSIVVIGIYLGFKREFSKLIGFLVVALIAVGLVFNAGGVKDVLLELFNKIIGAYGTDKTGNQQSTSRCYQLCGGVRAVRFIYCLCSRLYQEDK